MKYLFSVWRPLLDSVRGTRRQSESVSVEASPSKGGDPIVAEPSPSLEATRRHSFEGTLLADVAGKDRRLAIELAVHFTRFWTRLMVARVDSSVRCIADALSATPNHEAIGCRMSYLLLDYAESLKALPEWAGEPLERRALADIATDIIANVARVQRGGHRPFAALGSHIASAAREAVRASEGAGRRATLPGDLSPDAVAQAARACDWAEVGFFAATLGTAGAFGVTATAGFAMTIAALATVGSPVAVTTLIFAGVAAFGGRLDSRFISGSDGIERALAEWIELGAREGVSPDAPPASAVHTRGMGSSGDVRKEGSGR